MHRKETIEQWQKDLYDEQEKTPKYITVEQAGEYFNIKSTSHVHHRLQVMVRYGKAERVRVGRKWHYHIMEGEK